MASFADIAGGAGQAVSGIGGLISGITQASRGRNWYKGLAEDQAGIDYKYNQMAADAAQRREMENWHETFDATNAYNDPSAMRKRLEAAGLSKASMFEGTIGQPSSGGEMGTGESGFNPRSQIQGSDMNAFAENLQRGALISAQIADLTSSANLKDEEATTQGYIRLTQESVANLNKSNIKLNGLREVALEIDNAFKKSSNDNELTIQGLNIAKMTQDLSIARQDLISKIRSNKIGSVMDMKNAVASYLQMMGQVKCLEAQQRLIQKQGNLTDEQAKAYNAMAQMYLGDASIKKAMLKGFVIHDKNGKRHEVPPLIQSQAVRAYGESMYSLEEGFRAWGLVLSKIFNELMPF